MKAIFERLGFDRTEKTDLFQLFLVYPIQIMCFDRTEKTDLFQCLQRPME